MAMAIEAWGESPKPTTKNATAVNVSKRNYNISHSVSIYRKRNHNPTDE
jgi:hypothetical protein